MTTESATMPASLRVGEVEFLTLWAKLDQLVRDTADRLVVLAGERAAVGVVITSF